MLDSLTSDSVFAEILMDETSAQAFLLVEGSDESSVFFGHVSRDVVLIPCGGKRNVLGAASLAESNGVINVYGLVDRDFDDLRESAVSYPSRVVATQAYDLVADIVNCEPSLLRRALSAHASTAVQNVEEVTRFPIDTKVFELTSKLAGVRLASIREGYPLIFRRFLFSSVIGQSFETAELAEFLATATCKEPTFVIDEQVVSSVEEAFLDLGGSRVHSGGHDIVGASASLLRQAGSQVSTQAIAGTLIAAATCMMLASLPCLRQLLLLARAESIELLDCAS